VGHKEAFVTHLRQMMLDELQRRNYAQNTVRAYIHAVEDFAKYFRRSSNRLGSEHIREYQVHLFRDCKLSPGTIEGRTAALRFLFVKTLRRRSVFRAVLSPVDGLFWVVCAPVNCRTM
jgi:integrase/recombinase XerD